MAKIYDFPILKITDEITGEARFYDPRIKEPPEWVIYYKDGNGKRNTFVEAPDAQTALYHFHLRNPFATVLRIERFK